MKKSVRDKLKKLIVRINKTHGANTIVLASDAVGLIYHRVSTGSIGLDMGTGGGFCTGRVHLIIGKESAGKTSLCLMNIAEVQKKNEDNICCYVDGEQTFDPQQAISLGVDLARLILVNPDSLEQAGDVVQELLEEKDLKNLTIDSWASLIPTAEYEGDMDNNQMGKNALGKNKLMRKIIGAMKRDLLSPDPSCIVVITNHINMKIGVMFGSPETDSGGMAKNYFTSIKIKLTRIGWIKKTVKGVVRVVGARTKWSVDKNKTSAPKGEGEYDYYFKKVKGKELGVDQDKELLVLAKKHKFIKKGTKESSFLRFISDGNKKRSLTSKIWEAEHGKDEKNTSGAKKRKISPREQLKARKANYKKTNNKSSK